MIPESVIDDIQARTDIVEVVSGYLPLRRAGRHFKALCPFHHEKTPSFIVNPERQSYHCFGCGVGGDVFSFLMRYERMEFPEAIRHLAERVGVVVPEPSAASAQRTSQTAQLFKANEIAAEYYQVALWTERGRAARQYLTGERRLQETTLQAFRIGYATEEWRGLLAHAQRQGIAPALLAQAGLVVTGQGGQPRDLFRKRVLFPICDARARIIGFGGRSLDGSEPKYLNSPETEIYHKSRSLFGLHVAAPAIREAEQVVIVEGYLDQIMLFQAGVRTTVACLGTALTTEQARLLRRYAKRVIMVYDGDQAGEAATLRGLDVLIEEGFQIAVAMLPEGIDPDQFVVQRGAAAFQSLIGQAPDLLEYKMNVLLRRYDLREPAQKGRIASEMLSSIAKVPHAVERTEYVRRLAKRLAAREDDLLTELRRQMAVPASAATSVGANVSPAPRRASDGAQKAEQMLIRILLEEPSLIAAVRDRLLLDEVRHPAARGALETLLALEADAQPVTLARLRARTAIAAEHNQWLDDVVAAPDHIVDHARCLEDCVRQIRRRRLQDRLTELAGVLKGADGATSLPREDAVVEYSRVLKLLGTL